MARVQRDMQEGFILTKYFYEQLALFEKGTESLRDAIGEMVYGMDVDQQRRQASHIRFVSAPEANPGDATRSAGLRTRPESLTKETGAAAIRWRRPRRAWARAIPKRRWPRRKPRSTKNRAMRGRRNF